MLTRWVNVSDGQQRVRFKYLKQKDVARILNPLRAKKQQLESKGEDATEEEKYLQFKLGNQLKLKPESVTNLIENKAILRGLYAAFKRARQARAERDIVVENQKCLVAVERSGCGHFWMASRESLYLSFFSSNQSAGASISPLGHRARTMAPC